MTEFYDVYVGNLSAAISPPNLRDLFSSVGKIAFVWINLTHETFTYGFVAFHYLDDARNACKTFNNKNINRLTIKVTLSTRTQQKLSQSVKKRDDSILLELPKRTGKKVETKADRLAKILRNDIVKTNDKQVSDFASASKEMDNISSTPSEIIKVEPEKPNLQTLEDLVVRYHKPVRRKKKIEIDIDLSKQKVLTSKLNAKLFDIFK